VVIELREAEVTLLLPVHNEADIIEKVILEFYNEIGMKIPLGICVSEDGSTDGTKEVLLQLSKKMPMTLVLGNERKGYMRGVKNGLRKACSDFVFFVDSDGQHTASDFWKLYEKRKDYDMIVGRKIKRSDPVHRIVLSKVFHFLVRILFRLPLHDPDTAFRLINVKVINKVLEETRFLDYSFWTEFTVRAYAKGFKLVEVPVIHRNRLNGSTRLYGSDKLLNIVVKQLVGLFKLWKEINAQKFRESVKGLSEYRKGTFKILFVDVVLPCLFVRWQFL
jgi:dolichol-phosphate mannosyltransferase